MQSYKGEPLKFINTFLRRDGERRVAEEEYAKVSKGKVNVYDLKWQVRVRDKFFKQN